MIAQPNAIIEKIIQDTGFTLCIACDPLLDNEPVLKVQVRPVIVKKSKHLQFTRFKDNKSFVENVSLDY